jgi:hypothetical protein
MQRLLVALVVFGAFAFAEGQGVPNGKFLPIVFDDWWNIDYVKNGCEMAASAQPGNEGGEGREFLHGAGRSESWAPLTSGTLYRPGRPRISLASAFLPLGTASSLSGPKSRGRNLKAPPAPIAHALHSPTEWRAQPGNE